MRGLRALLALLVLSFVAAGLSAFTLAPISITVAPSGPGSIATFRVKSEDAGRIAIKFSVMTRDSSPDGTETDNPAGDSFLVYPSRMVVEPGSQAVVKVQWRGPAKIDAERCFRFLAEQVPIDAGDQTNSSIKVMFRYIASLYVGTPSFSPDLEVKVVGAKRDDGSTGYFVEITNEGTRHVVALNPTLTLDGGATVLSSADLGKLAGANYLPGHSLRVFVPKSGAMAGRTYDAKIDFEGVY